MFFPKGIFQGVLNKTFAKLNKTAMLSVLRQVRLTEWLSIKILSEMYRLLACYIVKLLMQSRAFFSSLHDFQL